jgi:hypothetical protein
VAIILRIDSLCRRVRAESRFVLLIDPQERASTRQGCRVLIVCRREKDVVDLQLLVYPRAPTGRTYSRT